MKREDMERLLPEICAGRKPTGCLEVLGEPVLLKRGETGYHPWPVGWTITPEQFNTEAGVSPAQAAAMKFGSLFGFDTPGADPRKYDDDGRFLRTKTRRRSALVER